MKILVVGAGGREHALAWKLGQEAEIIVSPGNPGIARSFRCETGDPVGIATREEVDLVVIGPEDPLVGGLADRLRRAGVPTFGPGASGAQLEGSKSFAKRAMVQAGVPTAEYRAFRRGEDAGAYIEGFPDGCVIKASGNALGKGVVVGTSVEDSRRGLETVLALGEAADEVVIEERLVGREFSLLTLCSEEGFHSLPVAQDHKRARDGDEGPNTGGMGAFSPVAAIGPGRVREAEDRAVKPLLAWLRRRGIAFRGCLFTGIMLTESGPKVLEYNVRFGDPETQAILPRLGGGLAASLLACARGETPPPVPVNPEACVAVVVASAGYPGTIETGLPVRVGDLPPLTEVFYAGVGEGLVNRGGRVLAVSALGEDLAQARERAYAGVAAVDFPAGYSRSDIAATTVPRGRERR